MTTPSSTELFGNTVQNELVSGFLGSDLSPEPDPMSTTPLQSDEGVLDTPEDKVEA